MRADEYVTQKLIETENKLTQIETEFEQFKVIVARTFTVQDLSAIDVIKEYLKKGGYLS